MPINNVKLGKNVNIPYPELVNLYGCEIGDNCLIGTFCEIQNDVVIGNDTRIESHTFICSKVRIGNNCFIAHGVMFINDRHPIHRNPEDWEGTIIDDRTIIGSNATILPCKIGKNVVVGAGSIVVKDIPSNMIVAGNPARIIV